MTHHAHVLVAVTIINQGRSSRPETVLSKEEVVTATTLLPHCSTSVPIGENGKLLLLLRSIFFGGKDSVLVYYK
jgi:hypothetical protein